MQQTYDYLIDYAQLFIERNDYLDKISIVVQVYLNTPKCLAVFKIYFSV